MDVGTITFATDLGLPPGDLAAEVEGHGLAALFVTEHTHLPLDPGPIPWGGPLGPEYGRTFDPYVTLAVAAERTVSIVLGTGVSLVAQHDPIALAKAVATVDHLSGGRFELGVGFGWCRPEVEDHGVSFADRHDVVAEHVAAMRVLWRPDPAPFTTGPSVRFGPAESHPKPASGRPPVLLGAPLTARSLRHLVAWADGWMPSDRPSLLDDLAVVGDALRAAGRDADQFAVTVVGPRGGADRLQDLAAAGVARVLHWLPAGPPEAVRAALATLVG